MPTAISNIELAWACLNVLTKKRFDALMEHFGSLEEAWNHLDQPLLTELGCQEQNIMRVLNEKDELDLAQHQNFMKKANIQFISIQDEAYPDALRQIADPPVFLFAKGDISILDQPMIGIVGTRKMSMYGKRVIEQLVPPFVRANLLTVSGLALGIDAEVARQTIEAGGKTIAVLGHGLGNIYPRENARLAEEIISNGGVILSEYPIHTQPSTHTFPARNRIIAGLSAGTIVAEAASQSGALITASLALEYGREVFAVPGQIFDPNMQGTHQLITKGGAKLITSAEDVLRELGVVAPAEKNESSYRAQTPDEKKLQECLTSMPQSTDDLVEKSSLPIATVNATLTLMELKGGAKNVGMGNWVLG